MVREVRYFIIGGRGDGILPGRNGQEGALFFLFFFTVGGDLVYSSIVRSFVW